MIVPLYSDAHLETAKELFPDKVNDPLWLNQQWSDKEINLCKYIELGKDLESDPTLNHWERRILAGEKIESYTDDILQWYENCIGCKKLDILSVGCGQGIREIALSLKGKCKSIVGIDNAPYTNTLNKILPPEISDILTFIRADCHRLPFDNSTFDLVMSHAVIYCIPDSSLESYFSEILRVLKPKGACLISTAANLSPLAKLSYVINRDVGIRSNQKTRKQTGWMRDKRHIIKFIPSYATIKSVRNIRHTQLPNVFKKHGKVKLAGNLPIWISEHIYPFISLAVTFEISK